MRDYPGHTNTADGGNAWAMHKACSCGFHVTVETGLKAPTDMAGRIATAAYEAHLKETR